MTGWKWYSKSPKGVQEEIALDPVIVAEAKINPKITFVLLEGRIDCRFSLPLVKNLVSSLAGL